MNSLILRTASSVLKPLILVFSVFLFLRGHNEPGGGFVAGLVAAAAFSLSAYAHDSRYERERLVVAPLSLVTVGLLTSLLSGLPGMILGKPFMAAVWFTSSIPLVGDVKVGSPLIFDAGIYLLVCGVALQLVMAVMEHNEEQV